MNRAPRCQQCKSSTRTLSPAEHTTTIYLTISLCYNVPMSGKACLALLNDLVGELEGAGVDSSPGGGSMAGAAQQLDDFISELDRRVGSSAAAGFADSGLSDIPRPALKPKSTVSRQQDAADQKPELDPSKLDIRVGIVTRCWAHPDSDKLYCEVLHRAYFTKIDTV